MDAGLPVGTLFDSRKPEQMEKDLETATRQHAALPGVSRLELGGELVAGKAWRTGREGRGRKERVHRRPEESPRNRRLVAGARCGFRAHVLRTRSKPRSASARRCRCHRSRQAQRHYRPLPGDPDASAGHLSQQRRSRSALSGRADSAAASHAASCRFLQTARKARVGPSRIVERRRHRRNDLSHPVSDGDARRRRRRPVGTGRAGMEQPRPRPRRSAQRWAGRRFGVPGRYTNCSRRDGRLAGGSRSRMPTAWRSSSRPACSASKRGTARSAAPTSTRCSKPTMPASMPIAPRRSCSSRT